MNLPLFAGLLALSAAGPIQAAQNLARYSWENTPGARAGTLLKFSDGQYVRIQNTNSTSLRIQLLKIEKPPIASAHYALQGEVRYRDVQGQAFLEMWNFFPPANPGGAEGQYFTRTLGASGEMGLLSGSSDWRAFSLPFNATGSSNPPSRLEINLILPGLGEVDLKAPRLVQFASARNVGAGHAAWWTEKQAGWLGAAAGITLGCLGSIVGTLGARGKGRRFVLIACRFMIALGICLGALFVLALASRQPFWVWYLPGLIAALILLIVPFQLRRFQRACTEAESRRMAAADSVAF
jgi:hypothetical protein